MIIENIAVILPVILLIIFIILFLKNIIFNPRKYKCPIEKIIPEQYVSKYSAKQKWYLKRIYCITKCSSGCGILVMLKKIYWEFRKGEL